MAARRKKSRRKVAKKRPVPTNPALYARVKAQQLAGPNADALVVSTQLLCQMAEKEDGTPAFDMSDAPRLQRLLPEKVLNDLELFLHDIKLDIETAKKD